MESLCQTLFSKRDQRLIQNCRVYAAHDPAGLPGHNLMLIVAKLYEVMDATAALLPYDELELLARRFRAQDKAP